MIINPQKITTRHYTRLARDGATGKAVSYGWLSTSFEFQVSGLWLLHERPAGVGVKGEGENRFGGWQGDGRV